MTKIPVKNEEQNIGSDTVRIPVRVIRNDRDRKRELFLQRYAVWNYWKKFFVASGIFSIALVFGQVQFALASTPVWSFTSGSSDSGFRSGDTYVQKMADKMTLTGTGSICSFDWQFVNSRTSTFPVIGYLYTGGSNPQNGTLLSTTSVNVATGTSWTKFQFNYCFGYSSGTVMYAVVEPQGLTNTVELSSKSINSGSYGWAYSVTAFTGWGQVSNTSYNEQSYDYDSSTSYPGGNGFELIQFIEPYSGETTRDPSNWVLRLLNVQLGYPYYLRVKWTRTENGFPTTTFYDDTVWVPESSYETLVPIPKKRSFFANLSASSTNETSSITATAYISVSKYFEPLSVKNSSTISFSADKQVAVPDNENTARAGPYDVAQNEANFYSASYTDSKCYPPTTITDIGGGIFYASCLAGDYFFGINDQTTANFFSSTQKFEKLYPFKYFFDVKKALYTGVSTFSSSTPATLSLSLPLGNTTFAYDILSSSTLKNIVGETQKNNIFTVESYIFWIFGLVATYKIILFII